MLSSYYLPGVCLSIVSDDENEENVTPLDVKYGFDSDFWTALS